MGGWKDMNFIWGLSEGAVRFYLLPFLCWLLYMKPEEVVYQVLFLECL